MAYRKKRSTRRRSYTRTRSRRSYSTRGRRSRATYSRKRNSPARKRYRRTAKPQTVRIELVQSAGSDLSPYQQQMQKMREKTEPRKAKF